MKSIRECTILKNQRIAEGVIDMRLAGGEIGGLAKPGQFVNLYLDNPRYLLPRPISVCEARADFLRLVYGVVGDGTRLLSQMEAGSTVKIMGPLGNGFTLPNKSEQQKHILIGGGIGVPPMLELAKQLKGKVSAYVGFRDQPFLLEDLQAVCDQVFVATDSGRFGEKGNVLTLLEKNSETEGTLYACGPKAMLAAVAQYAEKNNLPAQVSLEERMACGFGVCVGCVVKITSDTGFCYQKVCTDGPVFDARRVVFA